MRYFNAGLDTRSITAFRIATAACLLIDLAQRARWVTPLYTDHGVLPSHAVPDTLFLSTPSLLTTTTAVSVLLACQALLATSLLLGYKPRIAAGLSFLLLSTLHARNPFVLNAGDTLLRLLLVWAALLPLHGSWSIEHGRRDPQNVTDWASLGLTTQVILVHAVNLAEKLQGYAWRAGLAVPAVYELDHLTTAVGKAIQPYQGFLTFANYAWLGLLATSPLILVTDGRKRLALIAAHIASQLWLAATMSTGLFSFIVIAALLALIPSQAWDAPSSPTTPGTTNWSTPTTSNAAAATLLTLCLSTAVLTATDIVNPASTLPAKAGLNQAWAMFAPVPHTQLRWYTAPATLPNTTKVDLITGATPPRNGEPQSYNDIHPTSRWRNYQHRIDTAQNTTAQQAYLDYLCSQWRQRTGSKPVNASYVRHLKAPGPNPVNTTSLTSTTCR